MGEESESFGSLYIEWSGHPSDVRGVKDGSLDVERWEFEDSRVDRRRRGMGAVVRPRFTIGAR